MSIDVSILIFINRKILHIRYKNSVDYLDTARDLGVKGAEKMRLSDQIETYVKPPFCVIRLK